MNRIVPLSIASLLFLALGIYSCNNEASSEKTIDNSAIHWYTMEEAIAANEKEQKQLFIDMYTSWCGWCKVMDKKTFTNPEVIAYINKNYYPVKFNAEQRGEIQFKGENYKWRKGGRNGIHMLAYTLLKGKASYPSFVILDKDLNPERIIKGYKKPEQLMAILN